MVIHHRPGGRERQLAAGAHHEAVQGVAVEEGRQRRLALGGLHGGRCCTLGGLGCGLGGPIHPELQAEVCQAGQGQGVAELFGQLLLDPQLGGRAGNLDPQGSILHLEGRTGGDPLAEAGFGKLFGQPLADGVPEACGVCRAHRVHRRQPLSAPSAGAPHALLPRHARGGEPNLAPSGRGCVDGNALE